MIFSNEQDQLFWKLAHELVVHDGYRILKYNENGEIWLERLERKDRTMIRILRYDLDWGNWLVQDIEETMRTFAELRKQPFRKKAHAFNIYISTYPPVDDWQHKVHPQEDTTTILIESRNKEEQLRNLFLQLSVPISDVKAWLPTDEEPILLMQDMIRTEKDRQQRETNLLHNKKPMVTYILLAINVMMFLLLEWYGSSTDLVTLIQFGAKYNPAILEGEWWRFVTPIFLHIGFLHLLMNSLALYYLGIAVESIYGPLRFLIIYVLAGMTGVLASFAFTTQISAGASGAIFGCLGALLFFGAVYPSLFFRTMGANILVVVAINLAFGFLVPMVDNSAHIGGLIGGFFASAAVYLPQQKKASKQIGGGFVLVFLLVSLLLYGFSYSDQSLDPVVVGQLAQTYIEQEEIEKARLVLIDYKQDEKEWTPELLFLLSYTEIKLGNLTEAVSLLEKVVDEKSDMHEAHYNLALLYAELEEYEKARVEITKALELQPNNADYQLLYDHLQKMK